MSDAVSNPLPEVVAERLRAAIVSQQEAPGAAITEAAVALRYGVARPTARAAIDRLVADGVLRREAHRSARVPELSRDDIVEIYELRGLVESEAMSRLREIPAAALGAHRALSSTEDFAAHDIAFHRALVAGTPSARLANLHRMLMGEVELCIGQVQAAHLLTATEVASQHQRILDAITAGDGELAASLAREHIAFARDALLQHYDETHR